MTSARHNRMLWETGDPFGVPSVGVPGMSDIGDPAKLSVSHGAFARAVVAPESMALFQVEEAGREDRRIAGQTIQGTTGLTQTRPLEMQVWG